MARERGLAEQVRTGLDQSQAGPKLVVLSKPIVIDPLDEVTYRKTARQHVREFACVMATFFLVIAGIKLFIGKPSAYYWIALAVPFVGLGYLAPRVLLPIWRGWMKFAVGLSVVMTTIILSIAWLVMFIPVGILFKLIGKRVMDTRFGAPVETYWEVRNPKHNDFKLLERQF